MTDALHPVFKPIAFEVRLMLARLARAEQHYKTFGSVWDEYLDDHPHVLDRRPENDGTLSIRLRRAKPLPVELSLAFGELLYELRAALDNCLYAVAVLVSGENPPPSAARLEWPVRITPAEWQSQASRYRDLPNDVVDALEAIQPYRAEAPDWNCLAILHELARVDRHRSVHSLGLYLAEFRLVANREQVDVLHTGAPGIVDDGAEIMRLRVVPGAELSPDIFDLELVFDVDVTDVQESLGPSGATGRPWGPLDARLRSLIQATREYTTGLLDIAGDHATKRQ
ncbi:hypothetical protein [Cryobacterium sp. MDB2-10]|uniref:hypothetical protein n=1 Tax=Cryobacterium sp. MDB2-10 TaxID=1259177 RepID=UPI0010731FF8|nr:hypothetical protein [Cryobacterium sp. MDB2-10]TFC15628.1 hypothetical protein E3O51_14140 [Cryobacterium sp. MDB2-10]